MRYLHLIDMLEQGATQYPHKSAYIFLHYAEAASIAPHEQPISYSELAMQAKALAAILQSQAQPGERALLVYQPGIEFIVAFFACLYAGILAVPVYPPALYAGKVSLLKAQDIDTKWLGTLSKAERQQFLTFVNDSHCNWQDLLPQLAVYHMPGNHHQLLEPAWVGAVAQWLEQVLVTGVVKQKLGDISL